MIELEQTYKLLQKQNLLLTVVYLLSTIISLILAYQLPTEYLPLTNSQTFFNNGTFSFEPIFQIVDFNAPGRYVWLLFLISFIVQLAQSSEFFNVWVKDMIKNNVNYFVWIEVTFTAAFVQYEIATRLGVTNISDIWYQALLIISVSLYLILVEVSQDESLFYIPLASKINENRTALERDRSDNAFYWSDFTTPQVTFMGPFLMSGFMFLATWFTLFITITSSFSKLDVSLQFTALFIFFLELCYPLFIVMRYYKISWFKEYFYAYTTFNFLALLIKFIIAWVPLAVDVRLGS